jgi:hypothetical protein
METKLCGMSYAPFRGSHRRSEIPRLTPWTSCALRAEPDDGEVPPTCQWDSGAAILKRSYKRVGNSTRHGNPVHSGYLTRHRWAQTALPPASHLYGVLIAPQPTFTRAAFRPFAAAARGPSYSGLPRRLCRKTLAPHSMTGRSLRPANRDCQIEPDRLPNSRLRKSATCRAGLCPKCNSHSRDTQSDYSHQPLLLIVD